jgi:hypothetical protein
MVKAKKLITNFILALLVNNVFLITNTDINDIRAPNEKDIIRDRTPNIKVIFIKILL